MMNPRDVVPTSIMPSYPWLMRPLDSSLLEPSLATLARLGVPYDEDMVANARADALAQARPNSDSVDDLRTRYGENINVRVFDGNPARLSEMDAVVAYLQSLGTLTSAAHDLHQETTE